MLPKGDRRDVPHWTWGKLAEETEVGDETRPAGDVLGLLEGGTVEVIGHHRRFGVLVRYRLPLWASRPEAEAAPDGALLFFPAKALQGWPAVGTVLNRVVDEAESSAEAARRLLTS